MSQTATIKHSGHLCLLCTCIPHCCDTEPTKEMLVDSSLVRWSIRTRCCTMSVLTQWPPWFSHFSKRFGKTMSQTATIKHSGHLCLLCTCIPHCCDTEPTKEMLVDSSLVRWSIRTRCCTMSVLTQWPGLLSLMKCQSLLEEMLR